MGQLGDADRGRGASGVELARVGRLFWAVRGALFAPVQTGGSPVRLVIQSLGEARIETVVELAGLVAARWPRCLQRAISGM